MLSIVAGGALAGFWGVLLGVPAVAVGKILLGHVWQTRVLGVEVSPSSSAKLPEDPPSVVPNDGGGGNDEGDKKEVVDPA
jgi:hypothetical protein